MHFNRLVGETRREIIVPRNCFLPSGPALEPRLVTGETETENRHGNTDNPGIRHFRSPNLLHRARELSMPITNVGWSELPTMPVRPGLATGRRTPESRPVLPPAVGGFGLN